jgi:hypothetical protein
MTWNFEPTTAQVLAERKASRRKLEECRIRLRRRNMRDELRSDVYPDPETLRAILVQILEDLGT